MLLEKVIAILAIQITNYMYAMIATVFTIFCSWSHAQKWITLPIQMQIKVTKLQSL